MWHYVWNLRWVCMPANASLPFPWAQSNTPASPSSLEPGCPCKPDVLLFFSGGLLFLARWWPISRFFFFFFAHPVSCWWKYSLIKCTPHPEAVSLRCLVCFQGGCFWSVTVVINGQSLICCCLFGRSRQLTSDLVYKPTLEQSSQVVFVGDPSDDLLNLLDPARDFTSEAFALFLPGRESQHSLPCASRDWTWLLQIPASVSIQVDEWEPAPALFKENTIVRKVFYWNSKQLVGYSFHSLILKMWLIPAVFLIPLKLR